MNAGTGFFPGQWLNQKAASAPELSATELAGIDRENALRILPKYR